MKRIGSQTDMHSPNCIVRYPTGKAPPAKRNSFSKSSIKHIEIPFMSDCGSAEYQPEAKPVDIESLKMCQSKKTLKSGLTNKFEGSDRSGGN